MQPFPKNQFKQIIPSGRNASNVTDYILFQFDLYNFV